MAIVTQEYYDNTFLGLPVAASAFAQLDAWAERQILTITRGRVSEAGFSSLPASVQTAVQNAICAQISYLQEEGVSTALSGISDKSFTVGKVSVSKSGKSGESGVSSMVCPMAISFLEQTGLLNPQVPTFDGWWC